MKSSTTLCISTTSPAHTVHFVQYINIAEAQQARIYNIYKNMKLKLLKTNTAIYIWTILIIL